MNENRPVVLLTGASGFIGRHLSAMLERDGWRVRRALRTPFDGVDEVLIETIGPTTAWQTALTGIDAIVHLAARVHRRDGKRETKAYHDVNTEGTLHLARCAAQAGVRQFIFISTVLVQGRSNDGRLPFSENDALTPHGVYATSKAAAEVGLRTLAQNSEMGVTVIRPPLVYGVGAKGNFNLLVKAVKLGVPLPFASIRNRRAILFVENLASFILQRLSRVDKKFDVFLLADEEQVSTPELIRRIAETAGVKPRLFSVPASLLKAIFWISGRLVARDSLVGSLALDVSKAASTGWRPLIGLDEGLRLSMGAVTSDKVQRTHAPASDKSF